MMPCRRPLRVGTLSEEWDWQLRARCRNMDTNTFFHRDGDGRGERVRREAAAKSICAQCPVIEECRRYALSANETFGIWGGTTESDRRENQTGPGSNRLCGARSSLRVPLLAKSAAGHSLSTHRMNIASPERALSVAVPKR
ncbi:WhiB family transcriptional regulator [Rhodococcus opacus]|uniref:WhiB family transcriptional regulator n=1 Tax=Rhodococcus opacus TaxID=37919 RepID=UPI002A5A9117|nr:WhiB family transcriptional regulator [Rhodococcus opacus]